MYKVSYKGITKDKLKPFRNLENYEGTYFKRTCYTACFFLYKL